LSTDVSTLATPRRIDTIERRGGERRRYYEHCERRRMEVLRLFCGGIHIKRVAAQLGVEAKTASRDLRTLMARYKVSNHAQLGVYVERKGLL
jgi:DNA-binding NarL/FixJ family response regulator